MTSQHTVSVMHAVPCDYRCAMRWPQFQAPQRYCHHMCLCGYFFYTGAVDCSCSSHRPELSSASSSAWMARKCRPLRQCTSTIVNDTRYHVRWAAMHVNRCEWPYHIICATNIIHLVAKSSAPIVSCSQRRSATRL